MYYDIWKSPQISTSMSRLATNIMMSSDKSQNFEVQSQNGDSKSNIVRQKAKLGVEKLNSFHRKSKLFHKSLNYFIKSGNSQI